MKYVQITVDGVTYTLRENAKGEWMITNKAPYLAGEYLVSVTATTEAGQNIVIDVDDPDLIKALTLIVNEKNTISGERMLSYYPEVIRQILEFQALMKTEGFEIDLLKQDIDLAYNEAYLSTMSESRVASWEKALKITPNSDDSLQDRRDTIISRIRGQGKLNTNLIDSIVGAFTEGTAVSHIENGVLYVKVSPPPNNKLYKFDNVVQELRNKVPAHLDISVTRNYSTWNDIAVNFADWNSVSKLTDWEEFKLFLSPQ